MMISRIAHLLLYMVMYGIALVVCPESNDPWPNVPTNIHSRCQILEGPDLSYLPLCLGSLQSMSLP